MFGALSHPVLAQEQCAVAIANPAPNELDLFGRAVSISGDVIVAGAASDDAGGVLNAGSIYAYRKHGTVWQLEAAIANPMPGVAHGFGRSVAASGDIVVGGAYLADPGDVLAAGAAYVYRYNGALWNFDDALVSPEPDVSDMLGISVGASGDVIIVGAHAHDPGGISGAGSAYIYRFDGFSWELDQAIPNPEPSPAEWFGISVAVSGEVAVVGAWGEKTDGVIESGAAYVYRYDGTSWQLDGALPNPDPDEHDMYAWSVSAWNDVVVVGAYQDDPGEITDAGSAYVFRHVNGVWSLEQSIANPEPHVNDRFGLSVGANGDRIVVGAQWGNSGGISNAGSAFVFRFDGATWVLDHEISNPDPTPNDSFGYASAISGEGVIVGAREDDPGGVVDAGSVYIFDLPLLDAQIVDLDENCVIDLADFGLLRSCLLGPGVAAGRPCGGSDFDGDNNVDLHDLALFMHAYLPTVGS